MILDVRTKKTIAEGITVDVFLDVQQPREVEYCPGNGSRYHLLFVDVDSAGDRSEGYVVTDLNSMRSMIVMKTEKIIHFNYVKEKLGCGLADAVCLAELIGHITGRPYVTSEEVLANYSP